MDADLNMRLDRLEQKVDAAYRSSEKIRKYFLWTGIVTLALIILPSIGLVFAIPTFLSVFTDPSLLGGGNW